MSLLCSYCCLITWFNCDLQLLKLKIQEEKTHHAVEPSNQQILLPVSILFKIKWILVQERNLGELRLNPFCHVSVTGNGHRLISSPNSNAGPCKVLPKKERPKSLDLSGRQESLRPTDPLLSSTKQNHQASDTLIEEEERPTDRKEPQLERAVSCSTGAVKRTGIDTGSDPLSLMTTDTVQKCDKSSNAAMTRRDLAEEIEVYMNNANSPSSSGAACVDLPNPSLQSSSPHTSPRPNTLLRSNTHLPLPVRSNDRLRSSPSLPLGSRDRERPPSLVSPSSPTSSTSSFSMDSLFTPTLDIFKNSVISAGKGVAEKASRFYSRLSSQTSLTQVRILFTFMIIIPVRLHPSHPNEILSVPSSRT